MKLTQSILESNSHQRPYTHSSSSFSNFCNEDWTDSLL